MTTTEPATEPAETTQPEPETMAVEERPVVEVMPPSPPAEPPAVREKSALEQAAEEMMATPGAPGRSEFLVLATTARILSMSSGAPKAVRDNPWLAFHLALIGRDLGISPSAAIALIDVIGEGEYAQLSISPELINAQVKRMGLGSIVPAASTSTGCTAVALLPGGRLDPRCAKVWPDHVADDVRGGPCRCTLDLVLGEESFTWEDAQQAGIVDSACKSPTEHTAACVQGGQGSRGKRCNQGYRTYPKRMFWWRSAAHCASTFMPEASIGIYTTEQLDAVVDPETGRPYDPVTVALPEGYEVPEKPRDPSGDLLSEAEDLGDEALTQERRDLRARIDAVTAAGDDARTALAGLWEQADEEGQRRTPPFGRLQRRHLVRARAVVKSVEDRLKKGDFGDEAKGAWADAATAGAGFGTNGTPEDREGGASGAVAPGEAQADPDTAQISPESDPVAEEARTTPEAAADAQEAPTAPAIPAEDVEALRTEARKLADVLEGDGLNKALRGLDLPITGSTEAKRKRLVDGLVAAEMADPEPAEDGDGSLPLGEPKG